MTIRPPGANRRCFAFVVIASLGVPTFTMSARAAEPSFAYVGLSCDRRADGGVNGEILIAARAEEAGSAAAAEPPSFPKLPAAADQGLSGKPVSIADPRNDEVTCGWGADAILVRHGASETFDSDWYQTDYDEWISVWAGNRRILSRFKLDNVAAILVIDGEVRACPHIASATAACRKLGDTRDMGGAANIRDVLASSHGSNQPGTIAVTFAADKDLCGKLIQGGFQPGDLDIPFLVKPDAHQVPYYDGLAPKDQDSLGFRANAAKGVPYEKLGKSSAYGDTAIYDLSNSGMPQLVVNFTEENHAFNGNKLVSIPLEQASRDAIELALNDIDEDSDTPIGKGWLTFSGSQTQYHEGRYANLVPGRIQGVTYILASTNAPALKDKGDTSIAVLLKPAPDGSVTKMCEYHRNQLAY